MFRLHRPDVLPVGDLGIVTAIQRAIACGSGRRRSACARSAKRGGRIARSPRWYLWRSLDNEPVAQRQSARPKSDRPEKSVMKTPDSLDVVAAGRRLSCFRLLLSAQAQPDAKKWDVARRPRPDDEARVRHVRGHVDEPRRQPGRHARSSSTCSATSTSCRSTAAARAGDADRRAGRRSTCSRASAPTASASPSPAIATACGTSGRWTWTGKDAKQISRERRWFVNSPAWSPDGAVHLRAPPLRQGALARRRRDLDVPLGRPRATACRSPSGTACRRTPASRMISPDGRYLYYSKDVTPGQTFEYNKDPNGTIYAIIRRDLVTGRERRAVSVQGGSVTPQVSPGRQVAGLHPPRAAAEPCSICAISTPAATVRSSSNVDKDLQEAWAIHGLYPQYAWTPDGKSIVIWGEGKIWRVDVASGKGQQVPFTAQVEQTLNDAVRFPQKVHHRRVPGARCCATSACRRTASWSSTARSAISTSVAASR